MKSYELIIETKQPPCGGKQPKIYKFLEITIEDPIAYVKQEENIDTVESYTSANGDLIVEVNIDKHQVQYQFTEI